MVEMNNAAKDLWSQILSRQIAEPNATVWEPGSDLAADEAKMRAGLEAAGWRETEIQHLIDIQAERQRAAPVTSPGVNPFVEAQHSSLCDAIEAAMDRLKLNTHDRVARGVEPRVGPIAAKTSVVMTEESIITIGSFLFRFCGLVARAFTRTLLLSPHLWESREYTRASGIAALKRSPDLIVYWIKIYASFAATGTHIGVPYRPSTINEVMLMEQIARAMEIFAIAHEYGHHHLSHGRDIEADPRKEEFDADQFALRICDEVDRKPIVLENPYLISGSGGVVLLLALETLSSIEAALGKPVSSADTHPPIRERLARFNSVRVVMPDQLKWLKRFRTVSAEIMDVVGESVTTALKDLPAGALVDW